MNNSEKIQNALADFPLDGRLAAWSNSAAPRQFFRLNLKVLSRETSIPAPELLPIFLRLTAAGLFNLSWEYHCTHCNGIPGFKHHFGELKSEGFCALCDLGFRNTLDKNIQVTFTAHPTLIEIPAAVGEAFRSDMLAAVKAGKYSMPGEYVSGLECLNNETFRELFGEDVLSTQESLAVETVTFLFTDIKGSTQMYSDLGDVKSYEVVREHFKILFSAIERNNGAVVKTIGDAVMGSFLKPAEALKAATEAHHEFSARAWNNAGYLKIKMGIHTGSAIAVNLNDSMDYFGNSVNLAARVQGSVDDHEIRFTKRVLEDSAVMNMLKAARARLRHRTMTFKGINGPVEVYTLAAP